MKKGKKKYDNTINRKRLFDFLLSLDVIIEYENNETTKIEKEDKEDVKN